MTRERQVFNYMFEAARNMTIAWADRLSCRIRINFDEKESGIYVYLRSPEGIDETLFHLQMDEATSSDEELCGMCILAPQPVGGHVCSFSCFDLETYGKFLDEMGKILDETGGKPTGMEYARFYQIEGMTFYA